MRRVTIVCIAADKAATVARLAALGVVHVTPAQPTAGASVEAARAEVERARIALALLAPAGDRLAESAPRCGDAPTIIARALALRDEQRALEAELGQLDQEHAELEPYGEFDPQAHLALAPHDVTLTLCRYPSKQPPALPDHASLHPLSTRDGTTHALVIARGPCAIDAAVQAWPTRSLRALDAARSTVTGRLTAITAELAALARDWTAVAQEFDAATERAELAEAVAGMRDAAPLAGLEGFCPATAVTDLHEAGRAAGWAVRDEAPAASDQVPTQLAGARWVRPVHAVLASIGVTPGYGEPDVSPVFLFFLLLFAGMLIGDAGYGALLILAMVSLRLARPDLPRQFLNLTTSIGVACVVWGALTGTWFGLAVLPDALDGMRVEWLAGADKLVAARNVMLLCFLLGAVHLTVAHLWAGLRSGGLAALAQLGWIASTWTMFFAARTMVLAEPFPPVMVPIAVVGVAMIALFMTPLRQLRSEWFNHVMLPLSLVSNFVDVVSYLRLFAVGTASVAVAGAFNAMAASAAAGGGAGWLVAVGVALFGHTLNLALCAMGVLVHGVRLNTLEFSAHVGLQWSGTAYRPLRRRIHATPETNLTT